MHQLLMIFFSFLHKFSKKIYRKFISQMGTALRKCVTMYTIKKGKNLWYRVFHNERLFITVIKSCKKSFKGLFWWKNIVYCIVYGISWKMLPLMLCEIKMSKHTLEILRLTNVVKVHWKLMFNPFPPRMCWSLHCTTWHTLLCQLLRGLGATFLWY